MVPFALITSYRELPDVSNSILAVPAYLKISLFDAISNVHHLTHYQSLYCLLLVPSTSTAPAKLAEPVKLGLAFGAFASTAF